MFDLCAFFFAADLEVMDHKYYWERALDYSNYRTTIDEMLEEGRTSGPNQSDALLDYTKMNVQRMRRWDKTFQLAPDLKQVLAENRPKENWLVITEAWCGDAAQIIPALAKMAEQASSIEMRLIWRDEYPELINEYLTNGVSKSIPVLIRLDENFQPLGKWGPRPQSAQAMFVRHKEEGTDPKRAKEELHLWYARNKQQELQAEIYRMLIN